MNGRRASSAVRRTAVHNDLDRTSAQAGATNHRSDALLLRKGKPKEAVQEHDQVLRHLGHGLVRY